jgi:LETM1 and EF-hand domain-containing protein 1
MPSTVSALAILIPQRGYATEQSTSNTSQSYPPPGFNAEQAKKPIPLDQAQSQTGTPATKADVASASKITAQTSGPKSEEQKVAAKKDAKKLTLGQKVKKELQHYWDGTKLLATEVKISSRLALKMAGGYELSRREHRQVRYSPGIVSELHMLTLSLL